MRLRDRVRRVFGLVAGGAGLMVTSAPSVGRSLRPRSREPVEPVVPVPGAPQAVRTAARHRGALIGVGLALVALGALAFLYVSGRLSEAVPVIAVGSDVERGAVLTEADLTTAAVAPDPALTPVSADRMGEVIGLRAAADLVAGSLLTEASVTASVVPAAGEAVVGVALSPGQMPGEPLLPGDVVAIVETPGPGESASSSPAVVEARVLRTYAGAGTFDQTVVDVLVPAERAPELTARVATGRIGVVLMSRER